jgi:hypothetical protein
MKLSRAQQRRLEMLADVPTGGERCRHFEGHGYAACLTLAEKGLAFQVGRHGLGGAFQITPEGKSFLEAQRREREQQP